MFRQVEWTPLKNEEPMIDLFGTTGGACWVEVESKPETNRCEVVSEQTTLGEHPNVRETSTKIE
jgi:hypothetical protein